MIKLEAIHDASTAIAPGNTWDAVVVVTPEVKAVALERLAKPIAAAASVDAAIEQQVQLLAADVAGGRLVLAPTGPLQREHDDVRRYAEAASAGVIRARQAGASRPLLLVAGVPEDEAFRQATAVAALGAVGGQWEPLEAREALGDEACQPVSHLGVGQLQSSAGPPSPLDVAWVQAASEGQRLARDLAGTEPERMAPLRFAEYCQQAFRELPVELSVLSDQQELAREYPLVAAVARASMTTPRHHPCVVRLACNGAGPIEQTLYFAGKGITYDTGGADIKAGGAMAGMSRDKGGAAAIAGFMHAFAKLRPRGVRVVAELGLARNSVGADSFVSDEIISSHAQVRVRIGNTDAEGRLVLADLLSHLRLQALDQTAARLFSVATLTGHSVRAVGPYSIALDNRAARGLKVAETLATAGDAWGDPFEISRLRREDWAFVRPRSRADDVLSSNTAPSSATSRGHQFPMAFLSIASGLAQHTHRDAAQPLAYTHIDIGGSAVEGSDWQHGRPTAAPVIALLAAFAAASSD